ncbi:hypothetical protein ACSQ67_016082 [Phaseolus vulgaris]
MKVDTVRPMLRKKKLEGGSGSGSTHPDIGLEREHGIFPDKRGGSIGGSVAHSSQEERNPVYIVNEVSNNGTNVLESGSVMKILDREGMQIGCYRYEANEDENGLGAIRTSRGHSPCPGDEVVGREWMLVAGLVGVEWNAGTGFLLCWLCSDEQLVLSVFSPIVGGTGCCTAGGLKALHGLEGMAGMLLRQLKPKLTMLENIYGFVSPALSAEELFMQGWCNLALEGSTGSLLAEDSNKGPTMAVQGACWCSYSVSLETVIQSLAWIDKTNDYVKLYFQFDWIDKIVDYVKLNWSTSSSYGSIKSLTMFTQLPAHMD